MSITTELVFERLERTREVTAHDHNLIQDLGRRLGCLWEFDRYLANADGRPDVQEFWRDAKSQEQRTIDQLKRLIKQHIQHNGRQSKGAVFMDKQEGKAAVAKIADHLATVARRFQEQRTGHKPTAVTVVLLEDTLVATDDDLTTIAGKRDQLADILQERYGHTKEVAEKELDDFTHAMKPHLATAEKLAL